MGEVQRHDEIQGSIVHEYDGILEADNHLPRWWLFVLFGTIAFGVVYYYYYSVFEYGASAAATYAEEVMRASAAGGPVTDDSLNALAANEGIRARGAAVYAQNCVACHGDKGEGKIGPNLTDAFWLHGAGPTQIHGTISQGVLAKGMPAWGPVLGPAGAQAATVFVMSLRNTNVPGKEPQGERVAE